MTVEGTPTVILNKFAPASLDLVNVSYRGFDSFVAKGQIIAMQSYSSNPAEGTNISLRDGRSFQVSDETVRLFNNVMR
jgi:hypothetical protein